MTASLTTCRITSAPDLSAPTLVNLAEGDGIGTYTWKDGFSLGEPTWSVTPSGLAEGVREITLPLTVDGDDYNAAHRRLSRIAQAVMRPSRTAWLEWRPNDSAPPTWFRLHQGAGGMIDFRNVWSLNEARNTPGWDIKLVADAWGIGSSVQHILAQVPVTQPTRELPEILGDVPAPAQVIVTPSDSLMGWRQELVLSAQQKEAVNAPPVPWRASLFTPGSSATLSGTAVQVTDPSRLSSSSGGEVLSGSPPSDLMPGTYACYALIDRGSTTTTATNGGWWKIGTKFFSEPRLTAEWEPWNPPASSDQSQTTSWVSCGEITIPWGLDPAGMADDVQVRPTITVWYRPADDVLRPRIRYVLLVPTDLAASVGRATTLTTQWGMYAPRATSPYRVNGEDRQVTVHDAFDQIYNHPAPTITGGYPVLRPGARNFATWLARTNPNASSSGRDASGVTAVMTVRYRPRWLHLAADQA